MSRHVTSAMHQGQPVTVVAGYDRPLSELYVYVVRETPDAPAGAKEQFIFNSLYEPRLDWTEIDTLIGALDRLGIAVPERMLAEIYFDQCLDVGNRYMAHEPVMQAGSAASTPRRS